MKSVNVVKKVSKPAPALKKPASSRMDALANDAKTTPALRDGQVTYFRITHWRDPVPHLPLEAMGFEHDPTEVWYNADSSSYSVCSSSDGEDPSCSDSLAFDLSIPDHLTYMGYPISDSC